MGLNHSTKVFEGCLRFGNVSMIHAAADAEKNSFSLFGTGMTVFLKSKS
jgi:hypothetical protein